MFRDQADRERFVSILGRTVTLFQWRLHAYVLMSNHYHLLLEDLPRRRFRAGCASERHLHASLQSSPPSRRASSSRPIQGDPRGKAGPSPRAGSLRGAEPVRAGLARSARDWKWSSYRATSAEEPAPDWLETRWTLHNFGREAPRAVRRYRRFVAEGIGESVSPWDAVRAQIYLGGDEFLAEVRQRLKARPSSKGIPRRHFEPFGVEPAEAARAVAGVVGSGLEEMRRRPRTLIRERRLTAWALRCFGMVPLEVIGKTLGVGVAQASVLAGAVVAESLTPSLRDRIARAVRERE